MQVRRVGQAYQSCYLEKGLGAYSVALLQESHRRTLVSIKVTHRSCCKDTTTSYRVKASTTLQARKHQPQVMAVFLYSRSGLSWTQVKQLPEHNLLVI